MSSDYKDDYYATSGGTGPPDDECPGYDDRRYDGMNGPYYDDLDAPEPDMPTEPQDFADPHDTYSPVKGPLCEQFWEIGYCGHPSCAEAEEGLYEQYRRDQEHDCAYDNFLDDPITIAYGVGSEMVHLMSCKVCDRESPYTMLD